MKKVLEMLLFIAIIAVLPGGALLAVKKLAQRVKPGFLAGLLALVMLSAGCAGFHYEMSAKNWIDGTTTSPETVMMADAYARSVRAQAYATRKCTDDPKHCAAVYGGGYGIGGLDTPYGYTMAGIQAVGQASGLLGASGHQPQQSQPSDQSVLGKKVDKMEKSFRGLLQANKQFMKSLQGAKKGKGK